LKAWKHVVRITSVILALVTAVPIIGSGADTGRRPKGIILFIGDGIGINQLRSAAIYSQEVLGRTLAIDSIATSGITTTYSADSEVTDSAAASTALYSGHKVKNDVINFLPDGRKVFTIGHAAKKAGLSVGAITTTRLTHATPAALYSHALNRDEENLIAQQLSEFELDVGMGGGMRHFIPRSQEGSKRKDDKNLIEVMKGKGYAYVTNSTELKALNPAVTCRLLGLFAMSHMAYELDRQNVSNLESQPDLAAMTKAALFILERNPLGFFVMVEGGRIDHACHSHDIKASICDTLAFDDAVRVALDYQNTHPDVLVVVTADHETGGLSLGGFVEYALDIPALRPIRNSLEYLDARIRKQPGDLEPILESAGFDLTDKERALVSKYPLETGPEAVAELSAHKGKMKECVFSWIHYALGVIESDRAKVGWASFFHTAQPVITYAVGPGQQEFSGYYDNTDIAKKMAKLLGLVLEPPASDSKTTHNAPREEIARNTSLFSGLWQ
jgi:alkaline phosphatase